MAHLSESRCAGACVFKISNLDFALDELFDKIERIEKLPDLDNLTVTEGVEVRDVYLHDAVAVALVIVNTDDHRGLVVVCDDEPDFVTHFGIAIDDRSPARFRLRLAAALAEVRQDAGRCVANIIDVFGAIGERSVDVAGVKRRKVITNALFQNIGDQFAFAPLRCLSLLCGYRCCRAPKARAANIPSGPL